MGALAVQKERGVAFEYCGVDVLRDESDRFSLTDMWRANGSPPSREPKQWRRKEGSRFLARLAAQQKVTVGHLFFTTKGRHGQTWGHWQAALAYAQYLHPDFHIFVNEKFRDWYQEELSPDLKADRAIAGYRRRGMTDREIIERLEGKVVRNGFTGVLKEHRVEPGLGYAVCTDEVNVPVLGAPASAIKRKLGIAKSAPTRDFLNATQLAALRLAELMATDAIVKEEAYGTLACRKVCRRAGNAVKLALESIHSETA